jgi:hypothetical protein
LHTQEVEEDAKIMMVDCHLHIEALNQHDLELMALSGLRCVVSHTSLPEAHECISSAAIFDLCDRVLDFHSWRARQYFIDTYVCVCVSMVGVPVDYGAALDRLETYLTRERVVGIGEIGLEPSSPTCSDLRVQEQILRRQLAIAKEHGMTVALHTPPAGKPKWVSRYLEMINEVGLERGKVVIDHADESVIRMITEAGCNAAISVQPWRKVRAIDAARAIDTGEVERILVDSDCGLLESDPLAVPRTALEMRKLGMSGETIRRVVWDNPRRVYGLA